MKKLFAILVLIIGSQTFGQKLGVKFLEQATKISFIDIDRFMTVGSAFEKVSEDAEKDSKSYGKMFDGDENNYIFITIIKSRSRNNLDISVSKYFDMNNFKTDLLDNDYLHTGINKMDYLIYKKEDSAFLISQAPNSAGAYQIFFLNK